MKIIRDIEQGTEEWLSLRMGKPTASDFSKIITTKGEKSKSLTDYAMKLASELLVDEREDSFKSPHMQRGNELEPCARDQYQEHTFNLVDEVAFIDHGDYGCSPDGLIGDEGMIEIKCPIQSIHTSYLHKNELPSKYKQQVQGQLFVANRKWCDFVSYNPTFKEGYDLFIKRVYRDEEYIEKLEAYLMQTIQMRNNIYSKIKDATF
jgi:putative phage-type endonuclease